MTALSNSAASGEDPLPLHLCNPSADVDAPEAPSEAPADPEPDPDAWRREVALRLARYRTRRKPRAPRYPSLLLPFDAGESRLRNAPIESPSPIGDPAEAHFPDPNATHADEFLDDHEGEFQAQQNHASAHDQPFNSRASAPPAFLAESLSNVIEFPRSAAIPLIHASTLADPVFDRPRIVEAPEIVPPPPALGGILIESALPEPVERRSAESKIVCAPISRRLLAVSLDAMILTTALAAFAAIFFHFNPTLRLDPIPQDATAHFNSFSIESIQSFASRLHSLPNFDSTRTQLPFFAGTAAALAIALWMLYQFLFIVFTGLTPGLRAAGLRLTRLDGSEVPRALRRWRVLASYLSAFSAGLGYLWCLLDQDSLCWHDRITRTCLQFVRPERP